MDDLNSVNAQGDQKCDEDENDNVEALQKMNEPVIEVIVGARGHFSHAVQDRQ